MINFFRSMIFSWIFPSFFLLNPAHFVHEVGLNDWSLVSKWFSIESQFRGFKISSTFLWMNELRFKFSNCWAATMGNFFDFMNHCLSIFKMSVGRSSFRKWKKFVLFIRDFGIIRTLNDTQNCWAGNLCLTNPNHNYLHTFIIKKGGQAMIVLKSLSYFCFLFGTC